MITILFILVCLDFMMNIELFTRFNTILDELKRLNNRDERRFEELRKYLNRR